MELKINIVEAAAELAEERVKEHYKAIILDDTEEERLEAMIYVEDEEGVSTYTKEAQEIFEYYYDYYFDVLIKCKTGEDGTN